MIVLALQTMDMEIKKETSRRNVSDNYFDISRRKLFTPPCTNLFHISLAILGNNSFFFFFFSAGEHFTRKVSTRQGKQRLTHWWIVMDLAHKQNSWEQLSESYLLGFRGVQLPLEFRENHVVPRFFESGSLVRNIARTGVKTCRVVS